MSTSLQPGPSRTVPDGAKLYHLEGLGFNPTETCPFCHCVNRRLPSVDPWHLDDINWSFWICLLIDLGKAAKDCVQCQTLYESVHQLAPDAFQGDNCITVGRNRGVYLRDSYGEMARSEVYELEIFRTKGTKDPVCEYR